MLISLGLETIEEDKIIEGREFRILPNVNTDMSEYGWIIQSKSDSSTQTLSSSNNPSKLYIYKKDMDEVIEFNFDDIINEYLTNHTYLSLKEKYEKDQLRNEKEETQDQNNQLK